MKIKETGIRFCQVCTRDFEDGQTVFYVYVDNSIVCYECAKKALRLTNDIRERKVKKRY